MRAGGVLTSLRGRAELSWRQMRASRTAATTATLKVFISGGLNCSNWFRALTLVQEKSEELTRVTCTRVKARNQLEQFSPPEMKTFSVAVVAAVLLALICLQESSALPLSELEDVEVPVMDDNGAAVYEEMPVDSWKMPYTNRHKRSPKRCKFCCNCCPGMRGCGVCCRF
uniref:Hepcidin n=2 Tax=Takifugu rubripes TaxID=31033 RepID=A0A674N5U9_TAKRU